MEFLIDGKKVQGEEGKTILEVALENGIEIPHFCWHPALEPYGACRLCLVEIEERGRKTLTTSCTYPAREGIKVFTNTEKVFQSRRFVIKLLLRCAPDSDRIKKLAEEYKVSLPSSLFPLPSNCIRCGLCVRVCRELIKKESIGFIKRGIERIPETPFLEENPECLACGACAYLCPTGRIKIKDGEEREIDVWHKKEELAVCASCGKKFAPLKQVEEAKSKIENEELKEFLELCTECRRKRIMINFKYVGGTKFI